MSVRIDKGRLGVGLDMTPMIDIVFLLMIFFLVATRLDEDARSLDVVLPQHAFLDWTGNDWECERPYRRRGKECGIP